MATKEYAEINVKGEATLLLPPERALLSITIKTDSTDKAKVTNGVISSAKKVEALLRTVSSRKENQVPAVVYWSRTSLSETSTVPYDHERKAHLQREYHASVSFDIKIQKFHRLGSLIHELVDIEHVESQGVEWILTSDTSEAQFSKLRTLAAENAVAKAKDYAKALGYEGVTPVSIVESQAYSRSSSRKGGLIPTDGVETQNKNRADVEDWEDVGDEAFQYTPEEVKMSQKVDAKFRAA